MKIQNLTRLSAAAFLVFALALPLYADDNQVLGYLLATEDWWDTMIGYYESNQTAASQGECGNAILYADYVGYDYGNIYQNAVNTCNASNSDPTETSVAYCNYAWYNILNPAYNYVLSADQAAINTCGYDPWG